MPSNVSPDKFCFGLTDMRGWSEQLATRAGLLIFGYHVEFLALIASSSFAEEPRVTFLRLAQNS